jgi:putative ABC transport system substrate-binding protein
MKRREFIGLIGGAAAWPVAARAEQPKVARIGALYIGIADEESFKRGLRQGSNSASLCGTRRRREADIPVPSRHIRRWTQRKI